MRWADYVQEHICNGVLSFSGLLYIYIQFFPGTLKILFKSIAVSLSNYV